MGSIMMFRNRTPSTPGAMNLIIIIILLLLGCACCNCFATSPDEDGCQNSTNPTLVGTMSDIIGVWNSSKYGASSFRHDVAKNYFQVWPEDMEFQYFCEDGKTNLSLTNFTYSCAEGRLDPRPYYDVGSADNHQPYYKHWYYWQSPVKQLSYPIRCEYNDIRRLYVHRFWREVMAPAAKAWAMTFFILEVAAVAFSIMSFAASLHIQKWRSNGSCPTESVRKHSFRIIRRVGYIDTIADCIHIFLLISVGFGMIEGVGHSDLHSWRATCFYNAGVIYTYLTLLAVASSLFRQLATSATACSNDRNHMIRKLMLMQPEDHLPGTTSPSGRFTNIMTPSFVRKVDELHKLTAATSEQDIDFPDSFVQKVEELYKMFTDQPPWDPLEKTPNDWRWQRIFGQFAVLVLLGTFLCFVDSETGTALENLAGILLAAIVAAGIWSSGVSIVLLVCSVCHIATRIHKRMSTNLVVRPSPNNQQPMKLQWLRGWNATPARTMNRRKSHKENPGQEDQRELGDSQLLQDMESQNSDDGRPEIRELDSVVVLNSRHLPTHQRSVSAAHTAP